MRSTVTFTLASHTCFFSQESKEVLKLPSITVFSSLRVTHFISSSWWSMRSLYPTAKLNTTILPIEYSMNQSLIYQEVTSDVIHLYIETLFRIPFRKLLTQTGSCDLQDPAMVVNLKNRASPEMYVCVCWNYMHTLSQSILKLNNSCHLRSISNNRLESILNIDNRFFFESVNLIFINIIVRLPSVSEQILFPCWL